MFNSLASSGTVADRKPASAWLSNRRAVRKHRILLIAASQGDFGGIEAFVLTLAQAVSSWPEFEVRVCFKRVAGCEFWRLQQKTNHYLSFPVVYCERASLRLVRELRWADLIHLQNVPPDVVSVGKLFCKPMLATIHNYLRPKRNLRRLVWQIGASSVTKRFYNSNFVWNTWEPNKKRPHSECVPTVCDLPDQLVDFERRRGFLFVGRWIPNKGIEELIRAYAMAKIDHRAWPLTIVGDGILKDKVHQLVHELRLLTFVQTPGFVAQEQKSALIATCKWLVAPANTREDLGLTPIEARAAGVGIIVTNDGGLPEAAGPTALRVTPGCAIELSQALEQAASMSEHEYRRRCEVGHQSLANFLRPIEYYREAYLSLLARAQS